jgi:hypothetical protein
MDEQPEIEADLLSPHPLSPSAFVDIFAYGQPIQHKLSKATLRDLSHFLPFFPKRVQKVAVFSSKRMKMAI